MSIYNYQKYKISLNKNTKKTQGLQVGDIVRRQYYDGTNLIYSLMCVLEEGIDDTECKYFVGALLEGDAPKSNELLDFVRITNLFNADRSGALYLTSNDSNSPYMDVVDGLGNGKSLCYPKGIATKDYKDSSVQYVIKGESFVDSKYIESDQNICRICKLTRNGVNTEALIGITQDFYSLVVNPNRVLISFKAKASKTISANVSLSYSDNTLVDGGTDISIGTDWKYYLLAITVENSGRFLRKIDLVTSSLNLTNGEFVCIADFNAVLLSDISNFAEFTQTRIGRLDGINDKVFGTLEGYGGYLSNLYASKSVNISGTLTAGDESGFASTFYAGKIYKNAFINSLSPEFTNAEIDDSVNSPTGIGDVIKIGTTESSVVCQSNEWLKENVNKDFSLSFWVYGKSACSFAISQNSQPIGEFEISEDSVNVWRRLSVRFKIYDSESDMMLSIKSSGEFLVSSFQLEKGRITTQYQPTDDVVEKTEEYGAWFNRGGIGGTIQNPLIKLNFDGEGSVGTKTKSLLLKLDGSGFLANKNIYWDEFGNVEFGKDVKLGWSNIDESVKGELTVKSIKIIGSDLFIFNNYVYQPDTIELSVNKYSISKESETQWYYYNSSNIKRSFNVTDDKISISPDGGYWDSDYLIVECNVIDEGVKYTDTITIRKHFNNGYTVEVTSSNGMLYEGDEIRTTLTANVKYNGALVDKQYANNYFDFQWKKYYKNGENWIEDSEFVSVGGSTLTVNDIANGSNVQYECLLFAKSGSGFPYNFPVIFGS